MTCARCLTRPARVKSTLCGCCSRGVVKMRFGCHRLSHGQVKAWRAKMKKRAV